MAGRTSLAHQPKGSIVVNLLSAQQSSSRASKVEEETRDPEEDQEFTLRAPTGCRAFPGGKGGRVGGRLVGRLVT